MHTYQAILVKYSGANNTRGAKYIASADAGRVSVSVDYALNETGNAARAVEALCHKFGWTGDYALGGTKTGWVAVAVASTTVMHVHAAPTAHKNRSGAGRRRRR